MPKTPKKKRVKPWCILRENASSLLPAKVGSSELAKVILMQLQENPEGLIGRDLIRATFDYCSENWGTEKQPEIEEIRKTIQELLKCRLIRTISYFLCLDLLGNLYLKDYNLYLENLTFLEKHLAEKDNLL